MGKIEYFYKLNVGVFFSRKNEHKIYMKIANNLAKNISDCDYVELENFEEVEILF